MEGEPGAKKAKQTEGVGVDIEGIINKALSLSEEKWDRLCQDSDEKWQKRVTDLMELSEVRTDKKITEAILASEKKTRISSSRCAASSGESSQARRAPGALDRHLLRTAALQRRRSRRASTAGRAPSSPGRRRLRA